MRSAARLQAVHSGAGSSVRITDKLHSFWHFFQLNHRTLWASTQPRTLKCITESLIPGDRFCFQLSNKQWRLDTKACIPSHCRGFTCARHSYRYCTTATPSLSISKRYCQYCGLICLLRCAAPGVQHFSLWYFNYRILWAMTMNSYVLNCYCAIF
jgi:hypothetical protein